MLTTCGKPNYQDMLDKELQTMANSEMWLAGKATRSLRPKDTQKSKTTKAKKGVGGRKTY